MTKPGEDASLLPPEPPASVPDPDAPDSGLVLASPAGAGRLLIEGRHTAVTGLQRRAPESILVGGHRLGPVEVDLGAAANVVVAPGVARREWIGPLGTTLETVVAAATLPLVALRWAGSAVGSDSGPPEAVTVSLPSWPVERGRVGPASVAWRPAGDDADEIAIGVVPPPESLEVVGGGEQQEAELRIAPVAGPLTIVVAAGPPARVRAAFAAAARLPAQARLAGQGPSEGLTLSSGIEEVDDAVAWARTRLARALDRCGPSSDPFWATLAAIGVGDRDAAATGLAAMPVERPARRALLAAGIVRTFGDARPALASARALIGGGARARPIGDPPEADLAAVAREVLAEALHGVAAAELIRDLRSAAAGAVGPHRAVGRRLPMAGGAGADPSGTPGRWLAGLLEGEPPAAVPGGVEEHARPLYELASLMRADPDRGWLEWRRRCAEGLRDGPSGPGTWDAFEAVGASVPVTAALLASLAFGLLGLAPDARLGRLRIAPRLPSHLTRFRADGIVSGETRLGLTYERDGHTHRYGLVPTAGAVPATVVFEPSVPGAVREIRIDGNEAELDVRAAAGRSSVPLQLPVDAPRAVEIVTRT